MELPLRILIQQASAEQARELSTGLGGIPNISVVAISGEAFWRIPGVDALHLTLSAAERFGATILSPHTVGVLTTSEEDKRQGLPRTCSRVSFYVSASLMSHPWVAIEEIGRSLV